MMEVLPLFPLNLVVFPHEDLNLHIFEPRYRQLINDSFLHNKTFGIPSYIGGKLLGYGTEVRLESISKKYEDGRMDIKTKGLRVFRIVDFQNPFEDKLYAGGEIVFVENEDLSEKINPMLLALVKEFYALIKKDISFSENNYVPFSYQIAHKIGFSLEQEYQLLTISSEQKRQEKLIRHLQRAIPILAQIERTKERIAMNGHFKEFDSLNF